MWLNIGDIRSFRPSVVEESRRRIELDRRRVTEVLSVLLRARRSGPRHWDGEAARAAFERQSTAVRVLSSTAGRLGVTAALLDHLSLRMWSVSDLVRHADRRAADVNGWLNHQGTLFLPEAPAYLDPALAAYHARQLDQVRQEVERDLRQAERLARDTDGEVSRRLLEAADPGRQPGPSSQVQGAVLALPPPPSVRRGDRVSVPDAFASAAWWRSLSWTEQEFAIREHPEWVGPRDGVPAWARHRANLVLLGRAEQQARRRVDSVGRAFLPWDMPRVEKARQALRDIEAVRALLSLRDGVPRQLLLVDASGELVTAAVAIGNVDTAEHVATYVGGFTTTIAGDLRKYDDTFRGMRRESKAMARDGGDVAVVTWLGYPAPQSDEIPSFSRSVLRDEIARSYADELASFLTGLEAARDVPLHSTIWAHSYGSTLAGNALLQTGAVDDVVLFGSPGVPFRRTDEVGLKPGGFNVIGSPTDPVSELGSVFLGTSPASVDGVRRLASISVKGMPNGLRSTYLHGDYDAAGTVSRRNLVAVAAGRSDLLLTASDFERRWHPYLPGPPVWF